jgi:putative transposase
MRLMGIEGKLPGRKTTRSAPGHKIYPNLLKGLKIDRPDKVWCVDITYTPTVIGPMYLVAIMDWHSRYILAWELSNSLDTEFCIRALEEALSRHPKPEYFHSDQGCQFTSEAFTAILKSHGITISMSGRGRAYDNIFIERFWRSLKTEKLYKEEFRSVFALRKTISEYMLFYNERRPHQALEDAFPIEVYRGVA